MRIELLGPARREFLDAVQFHESQAPRLGEELTEEFESAPELLSSHPQIGAEHLEGTRRVLLRRFPFDVVYVIESDMVLAVALAHRRRKPGYWRDRTG